MKLLELLGMVPDNTIILVFHAINGVKYSIEMTAGEMLSDNNFLDAVQADRLIVMTIRALKRNKLRVECI